MGAMNGLHALAHATHEEDREAMDEAFLRPLHLAAASNNVAVLRALLHRGAFVHVKTTVGHDHHWLVRLHSGE